MGLGYVGLCSAAVFATKGFRTVGIDIDKDKTDQIGRGQPPLHEPQLKQTLRKALARKRLRVTDDISQIETTDITFVTVGTPSQTDGSIDLTYVKNATEKIGSVLSDKNTYHLVVVKSTVSPGSTAKTVRPTLESSSGKTVGPRLGLAANPEFLKEGTAIEDTLHPDKVVIGGVDEKSARTLKQLYREFHGTKQPPTILTTPETAEMVKYASNAFLATKVSYINTIADMCQHIPGVDVNNVAEAIGHDPRIGPLFLKAGPGYGGSCFHKDLQALINYSQTKGYDPSLLRATEEANHQQASRVVDLSEKLLGSLKEKRIAVLGLAFKKGTDDIREAASVRVIRQLSEKGAKIVAYDPMAIPNARRVFTEDVEFAEDPYSAIKGADCSIIMTESEEIRRIRPKDYAQHMKTPTIVDARKLYNPEDFRELNFTSIGLGPRS